MYYDKLTRPPLWPEFLILDKPISTRCEKIKVPQLPFSTDEGLKCKIYFWFKHNPS
uniref:Uncharacterized protein n=1 Tax=Anguilla anguilla TaxID=7936 RepID=A0A0E9TTK0_ANGAN